MESLIQADIFFFIATIGFIVLGIAILIALIYLIKILLGFYFIVRIFKEEGRYIVGDLDELRGRLKEEGFKLGPFASFARKFLVTIFIGRDDKEKHKNKKTNHGTK